MQAKRLPKLLKALKERPPCSPLNEPPLLSRWLAGHDANEQTVLTNQSALNLPFQRWFKFKEAFSPQFIIDCAKRLPKPPSTCLDPFGGSGTSALTAQFLGIHPTTIEVNPFLADLIEAKLSHYEPEKLRHDYFQVLAASKETRPSMAEWLRDGPPTLVEPGVDGRWVFPRATARKILSIRAAIDAVETPQNRVLLKVVLGSILVSTSNVLVNGKGRKYRRGWETKQKTGADIEAAFRGSFFEVFSDICHYSGRGSKDFTLIRGDSRTAIDLAPNADFAVLSPPYPNSFDYTDIYNVELWMLGYMQTRADNLQLRNATLRSHVQILREYSKTTHGSKTLERAYLRLRRVRKSLWNLHIPEMICAYFEDMRTIIVKLRSKLTPGGRVFLAVGNSKYAGVVVDAESILKEIALANGFGSATSEPIRSMRSSAQQGGRRELTEALITLA